MINKKILLIILLLFISFLGACQKATITKVSDVNEFDKLIQSENTLLYDIRTKDECSLAHIPYFMCMGKDIKMTKEELLEVASNISLVYSKKSDLKKIIIFIGSEEDILLVFNELKANGYKNLYYFEGGYEGYATKKGDSFVPATGCDC